MAIVADFQLVLRLIGLRQFYDESAGFLFVAWFFHFFPFFLMARQLFLHHYMPALYFAVLLFAVGFDLATIRLSLRPRILAAAAVILAVIYVFTVFAPITYGNPWTKSDCGKSKWLETWYAFFYKFVVSPINDFLYNRADSMHLFP